jgi:ribosomal protein L29
MNREKNRLKQLDTKELVEEVEKLRRNLFSLRLAIVSSPTKDHSQFKKLRRSVAMALTLLRQKQQELAK